MLNKPRGFWILLIVGFGFLTTAIEVRYLHSDVVRETGVGWIPTIASALGALGAFVAAANTKGTRALGCVLLGLVAIVGPFGLYVHTGLQPKPFVLMVSQPLIAEKGAPDTRPNEAPPAVAPLSLTGLALIGMLVAWPKRDAV